jgi:hypothetical protein
MTCVDRMCARWAHAGFNVSAGAAASRVARGSRKLLARRTRLLAVTLRDLGHYRLDSARHRYRSSPHETLDGTCQVRMRARTRTARRGKTRISPTLRCVSKIVFDISRPRCTQLPDFYLYPRTEHGKCQGVGPASGKRHCWAPGIRRRRGQVGGRRPPQPVNWSGRSPRRRQARGWSPARQLRPGC